jgi:hypothetical protein
VGSRGGSVARDGGGASTRAGASAARAPGQEQRRGLALRAAREQRPAFLEIARHRLERGLTDRHQALDAAFAENAQPAAAPLDRRARQPHELRHAQPRAVEHLEHRAVAQGQRSLALPRGLDQCGGLVAAQDARQRAVHARRVDATHRIRTERGRSTCEAQEPPRGDERARAAARGEPAL